MIFNVYDKSCFGITLFKWGKFKLELWFIKAGYKIIPHSHPKEHIELTHIFGHAEFFQIHQGYRRSFKASFRDIGRTFSIYPGDIHWFNVSKFPLVFLNKEYWLTKPTSAAIDFQPT